MPHNYFDLKEVVPPAKTVIGYSYFSKNKSGVWLTEPERFQQIDIKEEA